MPERIQLLKKLLNADMIVAADLGVSGEMDGNSQSAELSLEMSGTYEYTVETEE